MPQATMPTMLELSKYAEYDVIAAVAIVAIAIMARHWSRAMASSTEDGNWNDRQPGH